MRAICMRPPLRSVGPRAPSDEAPTEGPAAGVVAPTGALCCALIACDAARTRRSERQLRRVMFEISLLITCFLRRGPREESCLLRYCPSSLGREPYPAREERLAQVVRAREVEDRVAEDDVQLLTLAHEVALQA